MFTSAQVDTTRDTVRFGAYVTDADGTTTFVAGAHNLLDGDSVYYFAPAGGTAVGGLVSGQRYIVNVVDSYTLKLLAPGTVEKAVSLPASQVSYDAATNIGTINAANTFAEGDAVTYHAPPVRSFGSGAVELAVGGNGQPLRNSDNTPIYANDDTIFLGSDLDASGNFQTGHGYATGDQITYTASGGNTVFGTAYTGPRTLYVIRIDQFRIKLADSLCHATGCADPDGNGPLTAIAQQALTLNPDRSASGLRVTHSIVRANDGALVVGPSLTPLVDGQVYFVRNANAGSFQLALTPGGPVLGIRNGGLTGGPHVFAIEGVNLTSAGSGEQKLVLDLTSAGNGAQRLDGIGAGDTLAGAPSGDLVVTASGSGSGGGFVDVKSSSSTASVDTRLTNTISAGAQLSGLDVVIRTDNRGNVASISTNGGGGFVSIGSADTSASLAATTTLTVAAGATLTATRNLAIDAGAAAAGNATAGTNSAGLGSGVHANASLTLRYSTTADIAGTLTAGADLTARSHTAVNGNASATAQGGGLGVDADATATVTVDSSSPHADVHPRHGAAHRRTHRGLGDRRRAVRAQLRPVQGGGLRRALRRGRDRQRGRADRGADRDPQRRRGLPADRQPGALDPGRLPRRRPLHPRRLRVRVRLRRGLRHGQDRRRDHGQGHGAQRVLHRDRRPDGRRQPVPQPLGARRRRARRRLRRPLRRQAGRLQRLPEHLLGGDVTMLGEANPELIVDETGTIVKLVNVIVTDELGNRLRARQHDPDRPPDLGRGPAQRPRRDRCASAPTTSRTRPTSQIWGNAGLFDYQETWDYVRITNASSRTLVIHLIDVVNGTQTPIITINAENVPGPTDNPANNVSLNETNAPGATFEFDLTHSFPATRVEIRNTPDRRHRELATSCSGPAQLPQPGEATDVTIDNPIGTTIIENQRGSIVVGSAAARPFLLLRTNVLTLNADGGSIGTHTRSTGGVITARAPIPVELIQFVDATNTLRPITRHGRGDHRRRARPARGPPRDDQRDAVRGHHRLAAGG